MTRRSRRGFLTAAALTVGALAGCAAGDGQSTDGPTDAAGATTEAPGLSLETLDLTGSPGGEVRVAPPGRPVLLDFFATWCAPCKPQMASLGTLREAEPDLVMRSLTRETDRAAIRSFWADYDGNWPVATDPTLRAFQAYGVTGIPTLVVLDAAGTEVWRHTGLAAADTLLARVEEARA